MYFTPTGWLSVGHICDIHMHDYLIGFTDMHGFMDIMHEKLIGYPIAMDNEE